jgi:hypothetical protein
MTMTPSGITNVIVPDTGPPTSLSGNMRRDFFSLVFIKI